MMERRIYRSDLVFINDSLYDWIGDPIHQEKVNNLIALFEELLEENSEVRIIVSKDDN